MTATDELRRLLDERGVEWRKPAQEYWVLLGMPEGDSATIVGELSIEEATDGTLVAYNLTHEQAIAITLGSRTCHNVGDPSDFCCSECGTRMFTNTSDTYTMIDSLGNIIEQPSFCPNCGRRVVEVGE